MTELIEGELTRRMLCYLRVTGAKVGLIINYRNRKLEWERIVLDTGRI